MTTYTTLTRAEILAAICEASGKSWVAEQLTPERAPIRGLPAGVLQKLGYAVKQEQIIVYEVYRGRVKDGQGTDHFVMTCFPGHVIFGYAGTAKQFNGSTDGAITNEELLETLKKMVFKTAQ